MIITIHINELFLFFFDLSLNKGIAKREQHKYMRGEREKKGRYESWGLVLVHVPDCSLSLS
jgi:hypothetical protein